MIAVQRRAAVERQRQLGAKAAHEVELGGRHLRAAPVDRLDDDRRLGVAADELGVEEERVVVADDAVAAERRQSRQHLVRPRSQRRHVAEADDALDARARGIVEHGVERDQVAVQVGDERRSHAVTASVSARSRAASIRCAFRSRSPSRRRRPRARRRPRPTRTSACTRAASLDSRTMVACTSTLASGRTSTRAWNGTKPLFSTRSLYVAGARTLTGSGSGVLPAGSPLSVDGGARLIGVDGDRPEAAEGLGRK